MRPIILTKRHGQIGLSDQEPRTNTMAQEAWSDQDQTCQSKDHGLLSNIMVFKKILL